MKKMFVAINEHNCVRFSLVLEKHGNKFTVWTKAGKLLSNEQQ